MSKRAPNDIDHATPEERTVVDRARSDCIEKRGMRPTRGMLLNVLYDYRSARDRKP